MQGRVLDQDSRYGEKMARRGSKRRLGIYFVLRFLLVEANDELLRILRRNLFHVEDAA